MPRNVQAKEKLEGFIDKLVSKGCEVRAVRKRPQIYSINGKLFNIRSRGMSKKIGGGTGFWYSVSFSVLQEVNGIIYLMTNSDYFIMLRSNFLEQLKDRMYLDRSKPNVGVFDIDWTEGYLVLKGGELERIWDCLHDINDPNITRVFDIGAG